MPQDTIPVKEVDHIVVRFAGDSGDGMQLTGSQFTSTSALQGNDIATFPDFPAEIRAPAGTVAGVSGFQVHIGAVRLHTPGDDPDVLVAMNPAALKNNIRDFVPGKLIILDSNSFEERNLAKAGYATNPLDDGTLNGFQVIKVDLTKLTLLSLEGVAIDHKEKTRCKNFCALGLVYFIFNRDMAPTRKWIEQKFAKHPEFVQANLKAMEAGYNYGLTVDASVSSYKIAAAKIEPGFYRLISGNSATALGLMLGAQKAGLKLFIGSYPITPASDILHELAKYKNFGVTTFQAEDEIAAIGSAIGAAYGGALGITSTSGPGLDLKGEAIGLAVMAELPLIVVDVQRAGPSTGLPTKTEQADLLHAIYGRHGECPVLVVAPCQPTDCFTMAIEACRLTLQHMTPVLYLSDGYIANGAEPWKIPNVADIPTITVPWADKGGEYKPYARNPETLARSWAIPGMAGKEHRLGGIEKQNVTGNVNYEPDNHEFMVKVRQEKVNRVANDIPLQGIEGAQTGEVLVLSWGGTYGATTTAVSELVAEGKSVGLAHLRYLNPMPRNLAEVIAQFKKVFIPELNMGQLEVLIRSRYGVHTYGYHKMTGQPFKVREIKAEVAKVLAI